MTARYAVFGQPIVHSLSPRIHALFGAQTDIAVDYRAIEADRATFAHRLDAFAQDGGRGANVTLPLKGDAVTLCAAWSERARRCESVNTLISDGDGWRGDSTDGEGLLRDLRLRHACEVAGKRTLLLGAGGAARAIAFALVDAGAKLAICNRTGARARALAMAVDANVDVVAAPSLGDARPFDVIIHATAAGHDATSFDLPMSLVTASSFCYDLSYGAAAQAFLDWAGHAGAAQASDGLGMLIEQAAASFALWHGRTPDTASVYAELSRERIRTGLAR
jgi:shikimate dehydrogenase